MKLGILQVPFISMYLFNEGYGKTIDFDYKPAQHDPSPRVLQLGQFVHPSTKNTLVGGINLNYLTPDQVDQLRYYLPEILSNRNLKARYWAGRKLLPGIFNNSYRTYNRGEIDVVSPGTLRFMTSKELNAQGKPDQAAKLQKRRDMLKSKIVPKRPTAVQQQQPQQPQQQPQQVAQQIEKELLAPQTSQDLARDAVRSKQAQRMISKIDSRLDGEKAAPEQPEMLPKVAPPSELEPPPPEEPDVPTPDLANADPEEEITDSDLPKRPNPEI
jgi:hypothetical protein